MKVHITEQALRQLCPGQRPAVKVYDAEVAGFGAQVTRAGRGSYFVTLKGSDGRREHRKLGAVGQMAAHEARELARQLLRSTEPPPSGRTRSARCSSGLTLSDFFYRRFLQAQAAQGKNVQTHQSLYRNHIAVKEALGHTQLKTTMRYSHLTDKARKQTKALKAQALCLA